MTKLAGMFSADGNSAEIVWNGGIGTVTLFGTFGSGTAKLQMSPDQGSTWVDVGPASNFTAAGVANFQLPVCKLRINLAGSSAPTLNYRIA